jgi:hypothetical protein
MTEPPRFFLLGARPDDEDHDGAPTGPCDEPVSLGSTGAVAAKDVKSESGEREMPLLWCAT